ncbi:Aldo-keto reductase family 1 member D1 [Taenia crassiceps]|uniref:Aldo-keto reductase family 1 member D1 n=1 Tax=Taenia crassiceps TaxID=6207 RepID=A0ABR4QA42_9CEST
MPLTVDLKGKQVSRSALGSIVVLFVDGVLEGVIVGTPCRGQVRPVLEEANVAEIARRHKKTPAQVLLRHGLQRGIVVLVKSVTPERIRSNFDVFDFELTDEEMGKLNATGVNQRVFRALALVNHPEYAFKDDC